MIDTKDTELLKALRICKAAGITTQDYREFLHSQAEAEVREPPVVRAHGIPSPVTEDDHHWPDSPDDPELELGRKF